MHMCMQALIILQVTAVQQPMQFTPCPRARCSMQASCRLSHHAVAYVVQQLRSLIFTPAHAFAVHCHSGSVRPPGVHPLSCLGVKQENC